MIAKIYIYKKNSTDIMCYLIGVARLMYIACPMNTGYDNYASIIDDIFCILSSLWYSIFLDILGQHILLKPCYTLKLV